MGSLAYIWFGPCSILRRFFEKKKKENVARAFFVFDLAGLHVANALCTFSLVVLHLPFSFLLE